MKFHKIEIDNINSLYGHNKIDIDRDLDGVPLFLIMGPTGSGKTTILDAICLALFGSTPRQSVNKIGSQGVADVASRVNSYNTGFSNAIVEFSLFDATQQIRNRYRATWEFWRAGHKPGKTAQPPKRILEKRNPDGTWPDKPLVASTTAGEYNEAFDNVLDGMTLEHFLRSVMLAQGDFAALLGADKKDKVAILDRVTDTSKYQQVGKMAYDRMVEEKTSLQDINSKIDGFEDISAEDLEAARARLLEAQKESEKVEENQHIVRAQYACLKRDLELATAAIDASKALKRAEDDHNTHRAEIQRFELDRQARPARDAILDLERFKKEKTQNTAKLPDLLETLERRKSALKVAKEAEAQAKKKLQAANDEYNAQKQPIEQAKSAQVHKRNAQDEVRKAIKNLKEYETKKAAIKAQFTQAEASFTAAQKEQQQFTKYVEANKKYERVAPKLPQLRVDRDALKDAQERRSEQLKTHASIRTKLRNQTEELEGIEAKILAKKEQIVDPQKKVDTARTLLETLLVDAERPRERRDEIDGIYRGVETRQANLEDLLGKVEKRHEKRAERAEFERSRQREKAAVSQAVEALNAHYKSREELLEKRVEINQSLSASELRKALQTGQECPVCGSHEHPKVSAHDENEHPSAEVNQEARLKDERTRIDAGIEELDIQVEKLKEDKDTAQQALTTTTTRLEDVDGAIKALSTTILEELNKAGFNAELADLDLAQFEVEYEALRNELREKLTRLEAQKLALDEAEDGLEKTKQALEIIEKELIELEQKKRDVKPQLESDRQNLKSAVEAVETTDAKIDKRCEKLRKLFSDIGIETSQNSNGDVDFKAAFEQANLWSDAWEKNTKALADANREVGKLEKALIEHRSNLENADGDLQRTQKEKLEATQRLEQADRKLADLLEPFDGKDPALVEKSYEAEIAAALNHKDACVEARGKASIACSNAETACRETKTRLEELAESLRRTQENLAERIEVIAAKEPALSTVDAVRDALLDEDEYNKLAALYERVQKAIERARIESERVKKERQAHRSGRPENFDIAPYSIEILEERNSQADEAVAAINKKLGGLSGEVKELEAKMGALSQYRDELKAQQQRYNGWKVLNDLIGTSTGKNFKEFAQALYLERIVKRANLHLKQLRPRYRLQTRTDDSGLPTLDFEIVDKESADSRRLLSTLSGGETFLVSLALALALADQQRIRVPMETLFLDEGFGTLDRESLQQAMETLQNLHASIGRTVVVISHVEALKDKIADQVVVRRTSANRSEIVEPQGA